MFTLNSLDKLNAVVVVLLVLSLVVQSIQAAIKKLFRLKSQQIEHSLVHLFYYVLGKDSLETMQSVSDRVPALGSLLAVGKSLSALPGLRRLWPGKRVSAAGLLATRDPQVGALYSAVKREFLRAGRVTPRGKLALDSVSREDLVKFIGRIEVASVLDQIAGDSAGKIGALRTQLSETHDTLKTFLAHHSALLDRTLLGEMQAPLLRLLGNANACLNAGGDRLTLAQLGGLDLLELGEARTLLYTLPDALETTVAQLRGAAQADAAKRLEKIAHKLEPITREVELIVALPHRVGGLVQEVERWYDTIMQSFSERYARSMKTCSLIISLLVVFLLNANLFSIYRQISRDDTRRALIVASSERITEELRRQQTDNAAIVNQTLEDWAKQSYAQIDETVSLYTALGFDGPQWVTEIPQRLASSRPRDVLETIFGWLLMTMLLSVGAPFWQDTLQSLFGLKNLLRRRGEAANNEPTRR